MSGPVDPDRDQLNAELGTALKLNGHLLSLNDRLRIERDPACALAAQRRHTARLRQLVQQIRDYVDLGENGWRDCDPGEVALSNEVAGMIDEAGLLGQTSNEETA